jgi:hypothetical protein
LVTRKIEKILRDMGKANCMAVGVGRILFKSILGRFLMLGNINKTTLKHLNALN